MLHLLKEKVCVESNFGLYVDYLTGKDLQWLYSRNKDEINLWLAESRTDLFELLESDRNVADIVTVSWAKMNWVNILNSTEETANLTNQLFFN